MLCCSISFLFARTYKEIIYFSIGVLSLVVFYFLKLLLWNIRGEEIISVNKKEIAQAFDYGCTTREFRDPSEDEL